MKIVIAGAGAVGTHLAKLLSRENHDITVIDESPDRLGDLGNNFDLLTVCASPLSIEALRHADVGKAALFIAVTPDEAHNMTCCMLASRLGAKKTVARVDNYEYTTLENREFFKTVGINSIIYPEMLVGKEIMHNVKHSWVRQWIEIQGGKLMMVGVKVRNNTYILGKTLRELFDPGVHFHIVAVKRGEETIIPHGDDVLCYGDVVYFMTMPEHLEKIREMTAKDHYPDVKNLFIMGGSTTAVHTIWNMPDYMRAKIFEADPKRCERLNELIDNPRVLVINGDGHDPNLLMEEGIEHAEAFAALSGSSEANILACLTAKRLGIHKNLRFQKALICYSPYQKDVYILRH